MKQLFKAVSLVFAISGTILVTVLLGACANYVLVHWYGPYIVIPSSWSDAGLKLFGYIVQACVITFPTVIMNVVFRFWQEERKASTIALIGGILTMLYFAPIALLLCTGKYEQAVWITAVYVASSIISSGGSKFAFPFENGIKKGDWRNFLSYY